MAFNDGFGKDDSVVGWASSPNSPISQRKSRSGAAGGKERSKLATALFEPDVESAASNDKLSKVGVARLMVYAGKAFSSSGDSSSNSCDPYVVLSLGSARAKTGIKVRNWLSNSLGECSSAPSCALIVHLIFIER